MEIKLRQQPHVFWLRDKTRRPVACIALTPSSLNENRFYVGVATHNPHDTFNKPMGRGLAIDRAKTQPSFAVQVEHEGVRLSKTLSALFVLATAENVPVPNRTRRAAKESLIQALNR